MEISTIGRPRNVGWLRAAALIYGNWGTSKAYVIGLALYSVGFAALPHLLAVCLVTGLVGVNYIWICRHFPTGGGVYTAAGMHSRRLAMVGGLLLLADYIVTASLSCLDGFHYLGFEREAAKKWAITAIFAIGVVNFLGPRHSGGLAVALAVPTVMTVIALIGSGVPHLEEFHAARPSGGFLHNWVAFVGMILALSGVEAAASSTGVLRLDPDASFEKPSVHQTSSRAILVVMIEVVLGTAMLSVLAMCLPAEATHHENDLLRYMADVFVSPKFGLIVGWVFGVLLLSAVNTAITGMVSLLYVMARDKEFPQAFSELNGFGVPWIPLLISTILPVLVLNVEDSVEALSSLYAIGVVGAIAINIGSCAFAAKRLGLTRHETVVMTGTFVLLGAIWITIAVSKLHALMFVAVVLAVGLATREFTQRRLQRQPAPAPAGPLPSRPPQPAPTPAQAAQPAHEHDFLGETFLVAARGWTPALEFALEEARLHHGQLLVLFIREVKIQIDRPGDWHNDQQARKLFTRIMAENRDCHISTLYSVSDSPADTIIDIAATFGVDTIILGGSRRTTLVNLLKGNVVATVAAGLPESMHLIVVG
ncbi:MAG: Universal stress protein family protein [Pedosphaera sp.]|nr:Universal stress protein family protein [Pedosphaera sp.]